jgi:cytochrome c-type biogenesis protein CcmH
VIAASARSWVLVGMAVLLGAVALVLVGLGIGATTPSRAEQVRTIAAGLRCPVCQDLSAADSPAPLARQMRSQIREQLAAGVPADRIRQRFVDAYGPSVLLTPPDRGWGRLARLMPLMVVATGGVAGTVVLRRSLRREAAR